MTILIVEDEPLAAHALRELIVSCNDQFQILPIADTIDDAVETISHFTPDLIFLDIHLADGSAFEIFKRVEVRSPVIFATAYDAYAVRAFEVNSIDYLLKPITRESVEHAFQKFDSMKSALRSGDESYRAISASLPYKDRFLVKVGAKLIPLSTDEILYFFADDKLTFLVTNTNKRYLVNYTLSQLESLLAPTAFFRLNRQYIATQRAIMALEAHVKGQVAVRLQFLDNAKAVISRKTTPELKSWLGR